MVSKLDKQTLSEFESHWVPHSYSFEPHLIKKALVNYNNLFALDTHRVT